MVEPALDRSFGSGEFVEIGAVARRLGVTAETLRTWERRYKVVVPHRGVQGQRLYDLDQIALLRHVLKLIRAGARASAAHHAVATRRPLTTARVRLQPSLRAPKQARDAVDELLTPDTGERFGFFCRLLASELVSNAVNHGSDRDPITLQLRLYPDALELDVQNTGSRLRIKSLRRRAASGGRGLDVVDALAESWSITTGSRGTRVWVRLASEPSAIED